MAENLQVQEAALTGESHGVVKQAEVVLPEDTPLGDRLVYKGTVVTQGRGIAIVTAVGMQTELGKIATAITEIDEPTTPLQRRMEQLSYVLVSTALCLVALVVILGLILQGLEQWTKLLEVSLSMAVAVVPEGLPAVITVTLAIGTQRMVRRHALIRKLPAVETLGSVTTICKTGTLTQNKMAVQAIATVDQDIPVGEDTVSPEPTAEALGSLLLCGVLCNDAHLQRQQGAWQVIGDPTEGALLTVGARFGVDQATWQSQFPRVAELPFDSDRKRMSVIVQRATAPFLQNRPAHPHRTFSVLWLQYSGICLGGDGKATAENVAKTKMRLWQKPWRIAGIVLLVLVLTAVGWFSYCPAPELSLTDQRTIPIYVTAHGWHTAIAWAQQDSPTPDWGAENWRTAPFVEFGWGDRQFYFAGDESLLSILRIVFVPSESVIHVASLPTSPDRFFSAEVQKLYLDPKGFQQLQTYIHQTFRLKHNQRQLLGRGQYGNTAPSNFYEAVPKYSLWFNCNTWTATALWHSGIPTCPRRTLTAEQLMDQVKQWVSKSSDRDRLKHTDHTTASVPYTPPAHDKSSESTSFPNLVGAVNSSNPAQSSAGRHVSSNPNGGRGVSHGYPPLPPH